MQVIGRVEVRDYETDAYLPDATVTLMFDGGNVSRRTGIGGDAAFSLSDLGGLSSDALRSAIYRIGKTGYEPQETPFIEREIVTVSLTRENRVTITDAPEEFPLIPVLAVVGGATVGLIIVALLP